MNLPATVKFIQVTFVDGNGRSMGKLLPADKWRDLLENKDEIVGTSTLLGPNFEILGCDHNESSDFSNVQMLIEPTSMRLAPWVEDNSLALVFGGHTDTEGHVCGFNPRSVAKAKLAELADEFGLEFMMGCENEFQLFYKPSDPSDKTLRPVSHGHKFMDNFTQVQLLPYFEKVKKYSDALGIKIDSLNMEYGFGQVEIPLKPERGMKSVDDEWLFQQATKYAADKLGMFSSYMTTIIPGTVSNGLHVNISLWKSSENVFHCKKTGKLSEIAQHFLAGLFEHSKALMAFYAPTVNCYRRSIAASWAPNKFNWGYRNRNLAFRVKTKIESNKFNYIENRLVNGSANIYMVVAATLVAGMDGIRRKLTLPPAGNRDECESVPTTLKESIEALKKDNCLKEGLGQRFVNLYIKTKEDFEIKPMADVNLLDKTPNGIARELEEYLNMK